MLNAIFSSVLQKQSPPSPLVVPCLHSSVSDSGTVDRCCLQVQSECTKSFAAVTLCSDACDRGQRVIMLVNGNLEPESLLPEPSFSSDSVLHREVLKKSAASFVLWQSALQPAEPWLPSAVPA